MGLNLHIEPPPLALRLVGAVSCVLDRSDTLAHPRAGGDHVRPPSTHPPRRRRSRIPWAGPEWLDPHLRGPRRIPGGYARERFRRRSRATCPCRVRSPQRRTQPMRRCGGCPTGRERTHHTGRIPHTQGTDPGSPSDRPTALPHMSRMGTPVALCTRQATCRHHRAPAKSGTPCTDARSVSSSR